MTDWTNQELSHYRSYHCPKGLLYRRVVGEVHVSSAESVLHKNGKRLVCAVLKGLNHKFTTECIRNEEDSDCKFRRVDIADHTARVEFELECDPKRAARFVGQEGVIVIPLGWT